MRVAVLGPKEGVCAERLQEPRALHRPSHLVFTTLEEQLLLPPPPEGLLEMKRMKEINRFALDMRFSTYSPDHDNWPDGVGDLSVVKQMRETLKTKGKL